jgi:fructuronate reductase
VIAAELAGPPLCSLIGFIAHDLARRHRPVTILSCDNRVGNGDALRQAVQQFAQAAQLNIDWRLVRFPNAMVDRITPATTDRIRQECKDPMAVPTEAFREWVIEDNFAGPRPDWPDVQFVQDVQPHELRKLRMLNGAHSFLAYAGLAQGYQYVHEAISDPDLRHQALSLMMEAGTTLPQDIQDQVPAYAQALLRRFDNTELAHRLDQIAMDGSQKLPYRILETLRARSAPVLIAAVRAWMSYCIAQTAQGKRLDDPLAKDIAKAANSAHPERMLLQLIGAEDLTQLILE